MTHGSLFSGIGGFDLASQWMEWENIFHCEFNDFGKKILKYYWPKAISYEDITKTDFTIHRGGIDILTGGFPCQPFSLAGKRKGTEDNRHLWPEMLRAIREIQPRWIVGENVLGIINWDGGLVFNQIQVDLEAEGYEVFPYVLPACSVNAPHRRDRVWFVAHSRLSGQERSAKGFSQGGSESRSQSPSCSLQPGYRENVRTTSDSNNTGADNESRTYQNRQKENEGREIQSQPESWKSSINGTNSNTDSKGCEGMQFNGTPPKGEREYGVTHGAASKFCDVSHHSRWKDFPTQSPIRNGDDGLSARLDGITFSKWRLESIKAGGNAIVPQVAYEIFKVIKLYDSINLK